jgi:hypothetical protein
MTGRSTRGSTSRSPIRSRSRGSKSTSTRAPPAPRGSTRSVPHWSVPGRCSARSRRWPTRAVPHSTHSWQRRATLPRDPRVVLATPDPVCAAGSFLRVGRRASRLRSHSAGPCAIWCRLTKLPRQASEARLRRSNLRTCRALRVRRRRSRPRHHLQTFPQGGGARVRRRRLVRHGRSRWVAATSRRPRPGRRVMLRSRRPSRPLCRPRRRRQPPPRRLLDQSCPRQQRSPRRIPPPRPQPHPAVLEEGAEEEEEEWPEAWQADK